MYAIQKAVADELECACYRPMHSNHRCREFCKGHDIMERMWCYPMPHVGQPSEVSVGFDDEWYPVQPVGISGELYASRKEMSLLCALWRDNVQILFRNISTGYDVCPTLKNAYYWCRGQVLSNAKSYTVMNNQGSGCLGYIHRDCFSCNPYHYKSFVYYHGSSLNGCTLLSPWSLRTLFVPAVSRTALPWNGVDENWNQFIGMS